MNPNIKRGPSIMLGNGKHGAGKLKNKRYRTETRSSRKQTGKGTGYGWDMSKNFEI